MNCLKCPISEECGANKMLMLTEEIAGAYAPTKVSPDTVDECPLLKAIAKVEELVLSSQEQDGSEG